MNEDTQLKREVPQHSSADRWEKLQFVWTVVVLSFVALLTVSTTYAIATGRMFPRRHAPISPPPSAASYGATVNDWSPVSTMSTEIRVEGNAEITGLDQGTDGREVIVTNVGSGVALLWNDDIRSVARDRLLLPASTNWALTPNTSVVLVYDAASERWRMVGSSTRYAGDH